MVDFNKTIVNRLNLFGIAPSDKWGVSSTWGAFLWGEGTVTSVQLVTKVISESLTIDSVINKTPYLTIINSISLDADMTGESLIDGNGYYYNFPDRTTEAEDREDTTYTSGTTSTSGWVETSQGSTPWS